MLRTFCLFLVCAPFLLIGEVKILEGPIGAEVTGLDVSKPLSPEQVAEIKTLLHDRLVVVIRDQNITAKQQVNFTKQFGDVEIAWDKANRHPDDARVHVINNEAQKEKGYVSSTFYWHWDKSFLQYPTNISFAYFSSPPQPDGVGTTLFSNMYLAYETLPEDLKKEIQDLQAVHSFQHMKGIRKQNYKRANMYLATDSSYLTDVYHPVVSIHPETGKKILNVDELSQSKIIGMDLQTSKILMKRLLAHATQEQFLYQHQWKTGDLVIWDNLALIHCGTRSDPTISRVLQRTNTSSRPDFEGKAIVVGTDELPANFRYDKLFSRPAIVNTELYKSEDELFNDLKKLRAGEPLRGFPPHALVFVVGKNWKEMSNIWSLIDYVADNHHDIEEFCLDKYLKEDLHERKLSGELSFNHLKRKVSILSSSWDTYFHEETPEPVETGRLKLHARLIAEAFAHTPIAKTEEEWFAYLQENKTFEKSTKDPYLLYFGGAQGIGRTSMVRNMRANGLIGDDSIVINTRLFFDYLQGNIPYLHKIKFWPVIHQEKMHLVKLLCQIAISNNLNVVLDTYLLENAHCKEVVDTVKGLGGHCNMIVLSATLPDAYYWTWCSALNKESFKSHIYEVLMFHKLFAQSWPKYIEYFDKTLFVDARAERSELIFYSDQHYREVYNNEKLAHFLAEALIDPDELADKLYVALEPVKTLEQEFEPILESPQIAERLELLCTDLTAIR